ncbi:MULTISPECIES: hypothetical protein [Paracoccus]|uniref:hypothetical protein n=1 Tax=Paracoccus TaxID=265 RepID=UPI000DF85A96|nr:MULTISPECIES: hypothetical protein [Paracoccus]MDF3904709.1 hypothetical protein [Paracoccus sp. AS002]RDD69205.1 hypothetical protein DVR11_22535 [Paracoccus versutus]
MNPVYLRMALYTLAIVLSSLGIGTFDPEAGTFTIDLEQAAIALAGAGVLNALVFWRWGKK